VIYVSYNHHSPALASITDACYCLPIYIIVFAVKMVNKKNVKNYLNAETEKLCSCPLLSVVFGKIKTLRMLS